MKKFNSSKLAIKLVVFAVLCAAFAGIGLVTGVFESFAGTFKGINLNLQSIIKVLVMAALVLAVENLILLIMSVIKTENRRTQSVISIVGSALKYIAAIVILGWGLNILGADVGTVVASIGILALIVGLERTVSLLTL